MDWTEGIQRAVDYIEDHLSGEMDLREAARRAACSPFYFQRIFGILCGIPLGEYIRYRRLTLAGSELFMTKARILDMALKYGYDSPESFTRAFVRFHGITPSQAKKGGALRSFSRVTVQILLKGGSTMDYRIAEKGSFQMLERAERQSIDDMQNRNTIPDFWVRSHRDGIVAELLQQTPDASYIYGISRDHTPTDGAEFDYAIGAPYGVGMSF